MPMRNKKAVSPLIATILLISFAVALGSVVLNWGRNLEVPDKNDECGSVSLKLRNLGSNEVCFIQADNKAFLNFVLENEGSSVISGLGVWIVGQKGTRLMEMDSFSIPPASRLDINDQSVAYDIGTYGQIKQIQFIPKVRKNEAIDICPNSAIKATIIGPC